MGAVVGGASAPGNEAWAIRTHTLRVLRNRSDLMGKLLVQDFIRASQNLWRPKQQGEPHLKFLLGARMRVQRPA